MVKLNTVVYIHSAAAQHTGNPPFGARESALSSTRQTNATVWVSGHTRKHTTIDTDSCSAGGEMLHRVAAIRAVLAVFIISVGSGFVPSACYPVLARRLASFDIAQPRSSPPQCRRHFGCSSSASCGRRSLHMALSGEVLAAGLCESRSFPKHKAHEGPQA